MSIKTVAVLKGGWSAERDVSLSSGAACAAALEDAGYQVKEIDVTRNLKKLIEDLTPKPDVVFMAAMHGRGGEDGMLQSVLEILEIPYTNSGPAASAIAMDKHRTREILEPMGVPYPVGEVVSIEDIKSGKLNIDPPYVVKPINEGSSVGVRIVRDGDNRGPLGGDDWTFGPTALVEVFIPGKDLFVTVMGGEKEAPRALTVTEVRPRDEFYNYESKYEEGGSVHILPAPINDDVFEAAKQIAVKAHQALGCSGVTRADFRFDDSQPGTTGLYFLETNTQPGMTATSLAPEQAQHVGMSYSEFCAWMVENAGLHS